MNINNEIVISNTLRLMTSINTFLITITIYFAKNLMLLKIYYRRNCCQNHLKLSINKLRN